MLRGFGFDLFGQICLHLVKFLLTHGFNARFRKYCGAKCLIGKCRSERSLDLLSFDRVGQPLLIEFSLLLLGELLSQVLMLLGEAAKEAFGLFCLALCQLGSPLLLEYLAN